MSDRPGLVHSSDAWVPPQARFEGESTMKHDFQKNMQARRAMIRPDQAAQMSDAPFADQTDYRQSYVKHPTERRVPHERELYKKPTAPFDAQTTQKQDFRGQIGDKTQSFKPNAQAFNSGAPLDSVTTNRNDYKKWPMERPFVHQMEGYKRPEGNMEGMTTHNATYREMPFSRVTAKRPDSANKMRSGPFEGNTSYADDYKKWSMAGRPQQTMRDTYEPNQAPFEGQSTQKAHYIQHPLGHNKSFRPDNTPKMSQEPFADGTMYRTDYTPKRFDVCPAISLDGPSSKFRFEQVDNTGHRRYNVEQTITPLQQQRATPNRMAMSVM